MTKNSGDWEGLQGHDDDPAQFKHKAWVHEGGVAYIYIYTHTHTLLHIYVYTYIYIHTYECINLHMIIFICIFICIFSRSQKVGTSLSSCPQGKSIGNPSTNHPKPMLQLSRAHRRPRSRSISISTAIPISISYLIIPCHVISYHILSLYHIRLTRIISYHIISSYGLWCYIMLYYVM